MIDWASAKQQANAIDAQFRRRTASPLPTPRKVIPLPTTKAQREDSFAQKTATVTPGLSAKLLRDRAMGDIDRTRDAVYEEKKPLTAARNMAFRSRAPHEERKAIDRQIAAVDRKIYELPVKRAEADQTAFYAELGGNRKLLEGAQTAQDFRTASDAGKNYTGTVRFPWDKESDVEQALTYLSGDAAFRANADQNKGFKYKNLDRMTDAEKSTLYYYVGKNDMEKAGAYLDAVQRDLNARGQQARSEETERLSREHPLFGVAANVGGSFGAPAAYLANAGVAVKNAVTGGYEQTDVNSPAFHAAHLVNDSAQGIHTAAYEGAKNATGSDTWGNIAAFAADTGLSIGQFASKLPLGPLALPLMGVSAGGMSTTDALERGANPNQALAEGTINGAVEILTEKLPVDDLFRIAKLAPRGAKEVLKNVLKQMGSEGTQEVLSEIVDNLADSAIMGDKSEYERYVQSLMGQGADEQTARAAATKQFYLYNVAKAGLGGALSGGVMAGGASAVGAMQNTESTAPKTDIAGVAETDLGQKNTAETAAVALPKMSMADFTDVESPAWNNVEYDDAETRADLQGRAHQEMVNAGQVVHIPESTIEQAGQSFPDLRTVKKAERVPLLKQKMNELKSALRGFLGGLKGGSYEFEVNGNILEARLYDTGIKEVMEKVTQDKASMLYHSEELFQNARYLYSTPDYEGNPNIYRWNYFYTPVEIGGETVGVRIAVRDINQGEDHSPESQIYNWGIKKGTTLDGRKPGISASSPGVSSVVPSGTPLDGGRPSTKPPSSGVSSGVPSDITLPQEQSGVNTEDMQKGGKDAGTAPNVPQADGLGAANNGFDPYSHLQNQKGEFHPDGEEPRARQVDVPTTDLEGRSISKSAATVMEAGAIPDEMVGEIQQMIVDGKFSYTINGDKGAMRRAERTVSDKGFDGAMEHFHGEAQRGVVSKDLMALGATLLKNAAQNRDSGALVRILTDYSAMSRAGAQATQANRLLKKMSPQGQLYAVTRSVENLQGELNKRLGDKAPTLTMDQAVVDSFLTAKDQTGRDKAMLGIWQNIADQVPATWMDKWNAWRYMAMLTNPRTHIRNIVGTVGFQPVRILKDRVGAAIEAGVNKMGGKIERTKSFTYSPELYRASWGDYAASKDLLDQGSRYHDNQSEIEKLKPIFTSKLAKPVETVRKGNSWLLEAEDALFKRITYADALAGFLATHKVKAEDMTAGTVDAGILDRARAYATQEALKATYQDRNAVSDIAASFGRGSKTIPGKALSALSEGVLPFRRTPANIALRGVEYSPLGLAKSLTYDLYKVKKGDMTAAEAIDGIASGLTGSALMGLGAFLFSIGLVSSGGGDDEKEDAMRDLTGGQDYALQLPDGWSVTLDWLAPEALPFFMGVELADSIGRNGFSAQNLGDTLGAVADPMLELSMLQSLNDALDSISYSDNKIQALVSSALVSYLGQAVPTIGGQIERTAEDKRMTTYTDKNNKWLSPDMQYAIGRSSARIPGKDFQQMPYIDAWGRTESSGSVGTRAANNFLNPAFVSKSNVTEVDKEILKVYRETGDGSMIPGRAPKTVTYGGTDYDLTKEEFTEYQKRLGTVTYDLMQSMMDGDAYDKGSPEEKAKMLDDVTSYANDLAKREVLAGRGVDYQSSSWEKAYKITEAGIPFDVYLSYKKQLATLKDSGTAAKANSSVRQKIFKDKHLTEKQKGILDETILSDAVFIPKDVTVDYSDEESFAVSQMSQAAQKRYPEVKKAFDTTPEVFSKAWSIYGEDGIKKQEKLEKLRGLGLSSNEAARLYTMFGKR